MAKAKKSNLPDTIEKCHDMIAELSVNNANLKRRIEELLHANNRYQEDARFHKQSVDEISKRAARVEAERQALVDAVSEAINNTGARPSGGYLMGYPFPPPPFRGRFW